MDIATPGGDEPAERLHPDKSADATQLNPDSETTLRNGEIPAIFVPQETLSRTRLPFPGHYHDLDVSYEEASRTLWCAMRLEQALSFTPGLLRDAHVLQCAIRGTFLAGRPEIRRPRYCVLSSARPGVFNLGGDLALFIDAIERGDRAALVRYAHGCINVMYSVFVDMDVPVITVALVEGDALGGGFELALSCDVIIADRTARFGLPEILFNLFPGMGAYSILSRRLGAAEAERMIADGRVYSAEEMLEAGLVHAVVEPGKGREAVRDHIARSGSRHNARMAMYRAGRIVNPLPFNELEAVVDVWVDAALRVSSTDIRRMKRLLTAQKWAIAPR